MEFNYITVQSDEGEIFYMSLQEIQAIPKLAEIVFSQKDEMNKSTFKMHNVSSSTIKIIRQYIYHYGVAGMPESSQANEGMSTESFSVGVEKGDSQKSREYADSAVPDKSRNTFHQLLAAADDKQVSQLQRAASWFGMMSLQEAIAKEISQRRADH